jgi:hypothetical protein
MRNMFSHLLRFEKMSAILGFSRTLVLPSSHDAADRSNELLGLQKRLLGIGESPVWTLKIRIERDMRVAETIQLASHCSFQVDLDLSGALPGIC